ncbi:glutamate--cysteine ligase [Hypericibacter terrae]|uniref:Glutamate--cysteine ligase n=2 Tax=Hypericibacter terrae TaxID=2602015 RepID=A0A5J6MGU4_9PROT|nr:glutamate--cysteine ligase [Hypericibacter terrae]
MIDYIAQGSKPRERWRIGTEHEKFGFNQRDLRPLPYDGPAGVRALLEGLTRFGWKPVLEEGKPIALTLDNCNITLEPGGQFELSGAPLETIHETCRETCTHLNQVKEVCTELGVGMLGMGFQPKWKREDVIWMPKGRYKIMREQMQRKGKLGLDMMLRTCTVQVNLDYSSEADMVKKMRVGLALQPIATALFADSPFIEGKPNGFQSFRSHVWTDTDPDRCGTLPFAFEPSFGFERYVDYMLDVPMYFVYRDNRYIDVAGQSFRDFLQGKLPGLPGEIPGLGDFMDHLTTAFPEVRLKRFLEMRGADSGPWDRICALPALWVGLLYDDVALDGAWELVKSWTAEDRDRMRVDAPKIALEAKVRGRSMRDIARDVLALSRAGLSRRARLDSTGQDESHFLNALTEIVDSGKTPAQLKLDAYHGRWNGSVDPIFRECAYWKGPVPAE